MLYKPNPGLPRQIQAETKFFQAGPNLAERIKENQGKALGIALISLFESSLFKALRRPPKGLFSFFPAG
jgi:hypothetical protein